jgi:4'-phosphopantetheinyl transferase
MMPDVTNRPGNTTASGAALAPRALREGEIHVLLCFVDDLRDRELVESYSRWLSPEERARGGRFVFEKDRLLHLLARVLVRTSLSQITAVDPGQWQFTQTPHGRPELARPAFDGEGLRFNVSHTPGLVACAIARTHDVGIDVESGSRTVPTAELARRFFSRSEAEHIASVDVPLRQARFLALWTLKEAYLKAKGFGLSLPLDSLCATTADDGSLEVVLRPDVEPEPAAWSFLPFRFGVHYSGAVAVRGGLGDGIRARVARVVPFSSEDWLADVSLLGPPRVSTIDLA